MKWDANDYGVGTCVGEVLVVELLKETYIDVATQLLTLRIKMVWWLSRPEERIDQLRYVVTVLADTIRRAPRTTAQHRAMLDRLLALAETEHFLALEREKK